MTGPAEGQSQSTDRKSNVRGILAMCAAMAFFIANDALVKLAAVELPTYQIIFVRGVVASIAILAATVATGAHRQWRALLHPVIAVRSLLEAFVAYSFIAALALMPVADITAITLLSPLLITGFGALLLGEDVRWRRWAAIVVGFIGMLLVVRPSSGVFGWGALLAVFSTLAIATRDLLTRKLPPAVPTLLVTASTIIPLTVISGVVALALPWAPLRAPTIGLLATAALLVIVGSFAMIVAFRHTDVSVVSPFRYTVILWAVIAGYVVFGDLPHGLAAIGIALIVASGLYAIYRETIVAEGRRR